MDGIPFEAELFWKANLKEQNIEIFPTSFVTISLTSRKIVMKCFDFSSEIIVKVCRSVPVLPIHIDCSLYPDLKKSCFFRTLESLGKLSPFLLALVAQPLMHNGPLITGKYSSHSCKRKILAKRCSISRSSQTK